MRLIINLDTLKIEGKVRPFWELPGVSKNGHYFLSGHVLVEVRFSFEEVRFKGDRIEIIFHLSNIEYPLVYVPDQGFYAPWAEPIPLCKLSQLWPGGIQNIFDVINVIEKHLYSELGWGYNLVTRKGQEAFWPTSIPA